MATDYGGQAAYGAQAWPEGQPGSGVQQGSGIQGSGVQEGMGGQHGFGPGSRLPRGGRVRVSRFAALVMLLLGIAGLGVSLAGAAMQLLPRQFTAPQQHQILDWEAASRWRELPAGQIFPATVSYPAPSALGGNPLVLTASRIGIARQATCQAATDPAVAAVLTRSGCQGLLRATYVDASDSFVVTVGVAAFPGSVQASAAGRQLSGSEVAGAGTASRVAGVRTVMFKGTPAAWFSNSRRQISASTSAATYVVLYTIGYADARPHVAVSSNRYAYLEMTSLGAGVKQAVVAVLAKPVPPARCPGTPGC